MGNVHLVTGYKGESHITSADQGAFNAAVFGNGQYVFEYGNQFSASAISNNTIRVLDGEILMQGRHIRINPDEYVDLTISNGSQGMYRNDLIVARYTKKTSTGIEDCNLVVIEGTASSTAASDPAYTAGDILTGNATRNDMPLYRVPIDGINVGDLVPLFSTMGNFDSVTNSTITKDRLPVVPITKGGTGATTAAGALTKLGLHATAYELNCCNGVTANIQNQLNNKMSKSDDPIETAQSLLSVISAQNLYGSVYTITSGDNLNDYITPGAYIAPTTSIAASLTNAPPYTATGFRLIVSYNSHSTSTVQFAIFNAANPYIYFRMRTGASAWNNWVKVLTTPLSPYEYGTTLPTSGTAGQIFFKI